jgi:circadian clock protein KaiB
MRKRDRSNPGQLLAKSAAVIKMGVENGGTSHHPGGTGRATMEKYVIKLYVTGQTPRAQTAIDNLRRICERELGGRYDLDVIDVLQRPQLAEDEKILATPTVVKELPVPIRRIIGDLSDTERVLLGLDLRPAAEADGWVGGLR